MSFAASQPGQRHARGVFPFAPARTPSEMRFAFREMLSLVA